MCKSESHPHSASSTWALPDRVFNKYRDNNEPEQRHFQTLWAAQMTKPLRPIGRRTNITSEPGSGPRPG